MKPIAKLTLPVFAILFIIPSIAMPQGRWDGRDWDRNPGYGRIENRQESYRAGYDDGYREGMRQGRRDYLDRHRYNDKVRELDRFSWDANPRFRNDFRKGFKNGYKDGYRNAFGGRRNNRWYR